MFKNLFVSLISFFISFVLIVFVLLAYIVQCKVGLKEE